MAVFVKSMRHWRDLMSSCDLLVVGFFDNYSRKSVNTQKIFEDFASSYSSDAIKFAAVKRNDVSASCDVYNRPKVQFYQIGFLVGELEMSHADERELKAQIQQFAQDYGTELLGPQPTSSQEPAPPVVGSFIHAPAQGPVRLPDPVHCCPFHTLHRIDGSFPAGEARNTSEAIVDAFLNWCGDNSSNFGYCKVPRDSPRPVVNRTKYLLDVFSSSTGRSRHFFAGYNFTKVNVWVELELDGMPSRFAKQQPEVFMAMGCSRHNAEYTCTLWSDPEFQRDAVKSPGLVVHPF
ncbi:hypothetical protein GLAREA_05281 [Glarea lozoyensis ATCC 20868]|uniref:Uncharacterized protein n=1 Tax=Glarea lozoyensis (strain ATCC 20868 / MF5171) TaxID=1116229 RepID=S3ECA8_GLAL2|nr:uncharacterized protein GLAREA_05281 [Glarea lozoyensis ATCC 20868]EPE35943.1 hypothetical protein GLAREA_05281 [Glarea lozoyensis ATCC 20868]